ncbi:MAG: hypothetical protein IJG55_05110, partial [Synergistaceae bacterium]|nr:hypothetical protein [Synergistaceae bacterium]
MSEKTSEEKLREELKGNSFTGESSHSSSEDREKSSSSRLRRVRRRISSGTDKSIGQRVDSFMDEFEKKIEESLAGGNAKAQSSSPLSSSSRQDKPRVSRKAQTDKPEVKEERTKLNAPVNLPHDTKPEIQNAIVHDTHEREKEKTEESSYNEIESVNSHEEHKDTEQPSTVNIAADDEPQVINDDAEKLAEHEDILQAENVNDMTQAVNDAEHEEPVQNDNVKEIPKVIHEAEHETEPEEILPAESV